MKDNIAMLKMVLEEKLIVQEKANWDGGKMGALRVDLKLTLKVL